MFFSPDSEYLNEKSFVDCIECGLAIIQSQKNTSKQLVNEGLPKIDLRISEDYGSVALMKTFLSSGFDIIGSPVNRCSKMNSLAEKNQFVIGDNLYKLVKNLNYTFKKITSDFNKIKYSVYSVLKN